MSMEIWHGDGDDYNYLEDWKGSAVATLLEDKTIPDSLREFLTTYTADAGQCERIAKDCAESDSQRVQWWGRLFAEAKPPVVVVAESDGDELDEEDDE